MDLYQGHKASGDYSQNPGHENYHLHRRHPDHGTKQRDCSAAHRLSDFLAGELGVHHQSAEISDRPSQEIEFLGLIADSIQMELQLLGSKIKNIRSDDKTLLQASQPAAREVSRSLGKLTHATHAMRAAPLFFRHLQSCLHAALQPMQDCTQPCPLTEEAREELSWWVTHSTCWNGKFILQGNPDLIIETDASQTGWGARCGKLQTGRPKN